MKIRWAPKTEHQLKAIYTFIAGHYEKAAAQTIENLLNTIEQLLQFPDLGKPGKRKGTRELIRAPFTVVYRKVEGVVSIEAVFRDNLPPN